MVPTKPTTPLQSTLTRRDALKTIGAGVAGAAAFGAVRPSRTRARARQAEVKLTWWDYYGEGGANNIAMNNQLQRYMDSHPGVIIERTSIPFGDLKTKLLQGATAGELPDIAVIDNPDHQAFAALGVLTDLTEQVTAWGQASSYFEGPWNSTVYQGKNYGIPDNSNCLVQWHNVGITGPEFAPPTTWDELTAAAAELTSGSQFGLAVSGIKTEEGTFQWLPFLWETGEDIQTINSEGGRAALQLWVDLVANGHMSQGILGWTQGDVRGQFQNGAAAIMINGPWQIPTLREESPDLEWQVSVLPQQKQAASILGGENYSITIATENVDVAWDILTWTQEPDNLKTYLGEAGKLPSRADLAEDEQWTGDPVLAVFIEQLKVAKPRAYGEHYPEISAAIQEAIQAAVSGQSDVASALAKAEQTITPLLPPAS
jgi:multiple sugar transport system substrate-binding protein